MAFLVTLVILSGATSGGSSAVHGARAALTVRPSTCKSGMSIGFVVACIATNYMVVLSSVGYGVKIMRMHGNDSSYAGVLHIRSRLPYACLVHIRSRPKTRNWSLAMALSREVPPAAAADDHREPERPSHDDAATDDHQSPSERPSHAADVDRSSYHSAVVPIVRTPSISMCNRLRRIARGNIPQTWLGLERLGHSNGINCTIEPGRHWMLRHVLKLWITLVQRHRPHRFNALLGELFDHRIFGDSVRALIAEMAYEPWPRLTPIVFREHMYRN